jgi:hypothetical protein
MLRVFLILALALTIVPAVYAQDPVRPTHSDPAWEVTYWNNRWLTGAPALRRSEIGLNHEWGDGSPDPSVQPDGFSARWTRYVYLTEGLYRFTVTSDDGIRLWVDGDLVVDDWTDHATKTVRVDRRLETGHYWIVVEYYENQGVAVAKVIWEHAGAPIQAWRGEYFNNVELAGPPVLVRDDAEINFDWYRGSPAPGVVGSDRFSVRWSRQLEFTAGTYRFSVLVDDGARLWVNGHLLIDTWQEQAASTYTGELYLPGGLTSIKMEYFENKGEAVSKLSWKQMSGGSSAQHWRGHYYGNTLLYGDPALIRDDISIDFNWGTGSPQSGVIPNDGFSARWARDLDLSAGRYRFSVIADDGVRLWVNSRLIIDAWYDQAASRHTGTVDLPGGSVPIRLEYYENKGHAVVQLSWTLDDAATGVVVDDTDRGFVQGGAPEGWRTVDEGYGGSLSWTWNNDWQRPSFNWARWYPQLRPGRYELLVYIPDRFTTTASARYLVAHGNGYTSRLVSQADLGGQWVSLGTYRFNGGGEEYLELTDATGEEQRTRLIAFDAARWVPR